MQAAFTMADSHVVLSYATDMAQTFDTGKHPGDAGFCWFPRPWHGPETEWESIYRRAADTMQRQCLEVYEYHG